MFPPRRPNLRLWAAFAAGVLSVGWFLFRVVPKPSRASYPCQRAALTTAGGMAAWLIGVAGFAAAFRRILYGLKRAGARTALLAGVVLMTGIGWMLIGQPASSAHAAATPWVPTEGVNQPIGTGRGIYSGRVTWAFDPAATLWDPNAAGTHWWDPASTDLGRVEAMLSATLQGLTGGKNDAESWDLLFKSFNSSHGKGDGGYTAGQKIVVKINQNNGRNGHADNGSTDPKSLNGNPQLILALVRSLVNSAQVASGDLYVYDITRSIGDSIFQYCRADPSCTNVHFVDEKGGDGREAGGDENTTPWAKDVITYSDAPGAIRLGRSLPQFVVDASYMINLSAMKNHGNMGPTLAFKNHYGTVHGLDHSAFAPGQHHGMVELMGSEHVGEKTVLFMIDFLYSSDGPDGGPNTWQLPPFGGKWPASLLLSQDGVAIESVGFDFVNAEWGVCVDNGVSGGSCTGPDNLMHEAALANAPPSGIPYKPNGDGVTSPSLGVHEHWNNATDKQYSRNLGTGSGIELFRVVPGEPVDAGVPVEYPDSGTGGTAGSLGVAGSLGSGGSTAVGGSAGTAGQLGHAGGVATSGGASSTPAPVEAGGCSCRTTSRPRSPLALLGAIALVSLVGLRRRRRQ